MKERERKNVHWILSYDSEKTIWAYIANYITIRWAIHSRWERHTNTNTTINNKNKICKYSTLFASALLSCVYLDASEKQTIFW